MSNANYTINFETTERQQQYVNEQESKGGAVGLVFADAFLRGMRDLGYKSTTWALCEQVDNAIQGRASTIAIRFGFGKSEGKPDKLAVIDNGVGMIPKMISYAVRWGGTDRENDRHGFGRYGYGLPSSAVSFAQKYTVYSKTKSGQWHGVEVDLAKLSGIAGDTEKLGELLQARRMTPPKWATEASDKFDPSSFDSGTIIVHEKMDRIEWTLASTIKGHLLKDFGVIYRHWLPSPRIVVDDEVVQPVDPLFLMESGRFVDATSVRAKVVAQRKFEVKASHGKIGNVKVRAAYLPPNFQLGDPHEIGNKSLHKGRFDVLRRYNGILICRDGRQIDCISPRFTKFQNYDRQLRIELDFDPELDEFFGITTAKQQIVIKDEMWDVVESPGKGDLRRLIGQMREEDKEQRAALKARDLGKADAEAKSRPSEIAMNNTVKFKPRVDSPSKEKVDKAKQDLEQAADKVSTETGVPKDDVLRNLEKETKSIPFKIVFEAVPEAPFYRPNRLGDQKRLIINTSHPFYDKLYGPSPAAQAGIEVLLFSIGEAELEAEGELEAFFKATRMNWSERLRHALDDLVSTESVIDAESAEIEADSATSAA